MKLNQKYTGQVAAAKFSKKSIKGVEDEKQYKRVGIIKIELTYTDGDLENFVDSKIANDVTFSSCSWDDEFVGKFQLNINDVLIETRIVKIDRKNKNDECKSFLTFETEDLEKTSLIGNYLKDKDNPANIELTRIDE